MSRRRLIPQPPIDPGHRPEERHDFWVGFALGLIGLMLAVGGSLRMTGVETTSGGTAWEIQLIRAFSHGGLRYAEIVAPADLGQPAGAEAAFRRAETARHESAAGSRVRVDLGASTPCPT